MRKDLPQDFWEQDGRFLHQHRQILFLGAPATGKSWLARQLALNWVSHQNFQRPPETLEPTEKNLLEDNSSGFVRTVYLHAALGYEHFMEGYRAELVQGQAASVLRNGSFKRICKEAQARPSQAYCLLLEDIEHSSVANLFGESLNLLQNRERSALLPFSGEHFQIPPNLALVVTGQLSALPNLDPLWLKNFITLSLSPQPELLGSVPLDAAGPKQRAFHADKWLKQINYRLAHKLAASAQSEVLGHGYFFEAARPLETAAALRTVLQYKIVPRLLQICWRYELDPKPILGADAAELLSASSEEVLEILQKNSSESFTEL